MEHQKKLEKLKNKFDIKHSGILEICLFLEDSDFKVNPSGGIIEKEKFVSPCIVFELKNKPKTRFVNENKFRKGYLIKIKKKSIAEMNNNEYLDYMIKSVENGETLRYKKWRNDSKEKMVSIKNLLSDFNIKTKLPFLNITEFEDGTARLDFGHDDHVFEKRQRLDFDKKKKLHEETMNAFNEFSFFIKK